MWSAGEDVFGRAEEGLFRVKRWFDRNRHSVNVNKTKCMPFSLAADSDPVVTSLRLHSCGDHTLVRCQKNGKCL